MLVATDSLTPNGTTEQRDEQQVTKTQRELLIAQVKAHPQYKYVYHEDPATCIRRLMLVTLRRWKDAEKAKGNVRTHLSELSLSVLYPTFQAQDGVLVREFSRLAKQYELAKGKGKIEFAWLLQFVLDKVVEETIPAAELVISNKGQKLLSTEVAYVLKTIAMLVEKDLRKRRDWGYTDNKAYEKHISNKYFLGNGYRTAKAPKLPKLPQDVTVAEAYLAGYRTCLQDTEALSKTTKQNSYPARYEKATGRTLNPDKFAAITKLLAKHGLITRREVPSSKGTPNCTVVLYGITQAAKATFR